MSKEEINGEEIKDETQPEEKDQDEKSDQDKEQRKDKPVDPSQFHKYREAYLREQLKEIGVKEGAEVDVAMSFIDERANESDSNLGEVFGELKERMRLDERKQSSYADPSPGNTIRGRPKPIDGREIGRQAYERLAKRGMIR